MARNVFISFLGTNNYLQTRYQWNEEKPSRPVRFIQEAIISRIAKDWTADDRIFIFYTDGDDGSYKLNWLDNGQTRFNEKEEKEKEIEKIGLQHRLNDLHLNAQIEGDIIPEGFSEDDVWNMFNIVYKKLKPYDKIYFDITHAFRSIPLFASSLFNFAQYMINVEVVSVNYGAFEKLGPAYKVKEMPIEQRIAPIVDMTNIVKLQKLTETATSITEFGRIKKLSEFIRQSNSSIDEFLEKITEAVEKLDEYIQTANIKNLKDGKVINQFKQYYKKARKNLSEPEKILMNEIMNAINDFVPENSYKNVEAAIEWTKKHEMISQAATIAQEYMISYMVDYAKLNKIDNPYLKMSVEEKTNLRKDKKVFFREFVGSVLGMSESDVNTNNFQGYLNIYEDTTLSLLGLDFTKALRPHYDTLRNVRNSLNHGKGNKTYDELKTELNESYTNCLEVIHQYPI